MFSHKILAKFLKICIIFVTKSQKSPSAESSTPDINRYIILTMSNKMNSCFFLNIIRKKLAILAKYKIEI